MKNRRSGIRTVRDPLVYTVGVYIDEVKAQIGAKIQQTKSTAGETTVDRSRPLDRRG